MLIRILIAVGVVALLLFARKSKPAGGKLGYEMIGLTQPIDEPEQLCVASFNIQTGKDLHGRRNLLGSAQVMANADLVGVQEVYAPSLMNLLGVGLSQTEKIAQYGGFGWLFCATRRRWLREHRGNAILSKVPIRKWRVEMLPDQSNKSFRNMTVAEVTWQNKTFHFINTHLHTRHGRDDQLKVVLQEFAKYPCAILVGDFNCSAKTPALADALKDIEIVDAIAVANLDSEESERIDWILTKGFKVTQGEMLEKGVSDHPYFQVKLSYSVT